MARMPTILFFIAYDFTIGSTTIARFLRTHRHGGLATHCPQKIQSAIQQLTAAAKNLARRMHGTVRRRGSAA
jgi:hypothetical protein